MARKLKKKVEAADDGDATEEESVRENDNAQMDSDDDIPSIVDKGSGDEDDRAAAEESEGGKKKISAKKAEKKSKKNKKDKTAGVEAKEKQSIPFMDTFYQLSSEESPEERSIAARDLIHHCFFHRQGINHKDAAYALTRLMNGLCSGRAASRQGFASCLSSFLRVAWSSSKSESDAMGEILKEDSDMEKLKEGVEEDAHSAMIVRKKLLSTTQFFGAAVNNNGKGQKKNHFRGKVKGIEERDHAFGRLFGILAVVRSGILGMKDFPSAVVECYTKDLIDLYHFKNWMEQPSAHAIIELVSSLDAESNREVMMKIANDTITPTFFLVSESGSAASGIDRNQWLQKLSPEQIAVALHLQTLKEDDVKYDYPLDEPLVTAASVPKLSAALSSTSNVVHPRCHFVWETLWMYLTEEVKNQGCRELKTNEEFSLIIESILQHVVVALLLGKGKGTVRPTDECRSLALQIVCTLSGLSDMKIILPPNLISSVLCEDVIVRVFENVLCASGGLGKGDVEHHLKPLTTQAILDLAAHCCEDINASRRLAFAKAFISANPRFDSKTKTRTVSSLLMLGNNDGDSSEESDSQRRALWNSYLSFLEEEIVSATTLHKATAYIELMYKFAKSHLAKSSADEARRVIRFFMSGAFFDCSNLSDSSTTKKSSSKKKKKNNKRIASTPELSSGLRIKEILQANGMASISHPARAIMSARFYSLLSDFISTINSQNREGSTNKSFYGKGSRPESIYRALSEVCGVFSLLETSGARQFQVRCADMDTDDASDAGDATEGSRKLMLQAQSIANDALVRECDGSGDEKVLRAKAMFTTSCASLMISLHLQLKSCGNQDADENEEDEDDDVVELTHEHISDLAECVNGFCQVIEGKSGLLKEDDEGNPLAIMAGLLVNILSSPVGGEDSGKANPIQASASKLTRETVKLAWSGIISVITDLSKQNTSLKNLVDVDVMSILIESVCGEKSMGGEDNNDDESVQESESSEDELGDSAVFIDASQAGMDVDEMKNDDFTVSEEDEEKISKDGDEGGNEEVELDSARLENLLLEDSDAEMSDSGMLEHHAGADKALAQLIKLKQEARKASQTERERIELCNRLRCAGLLDVIFTESVFKSDWLPVEAVLGSIVPILHSRKLIAKSIKAPSPINATKSMSEKTVLLDRLSTLVKSKISKFRCSDDSEAEGLALKASSDIYKEMKHSVNSAHCSCCSVALITAMRCIPNAEDNDDVKLIYTGALDDWSSRKATKIHACIFDDLIQRMPSLASLILLQPLITAARGANSPFLKCESIKLLSTLYKHDGKHYDEPLSKKASSSMKECCSKVAETLKDALVDSSLLKKAKHRDEILLATKHFVNYAKAQDEGMLTEEEICALQKNIETVQGNCNSGIKQLCSQVSETLSGLSRRESSKRANNSKAPKSGKKKKKSKK